jgi:ribose transport system substrate-binding protein
MKRSLRTVIVVLVATVMLATFALSGCQTITDVAESAIAAVETAVTATTVAAETTAAADSVVAGTPAAYLGDASEVYYMIAFLSGHPFWVGCRLGMEAAAAQLGVSTKYGGDPEYDVTKAVSAFETIVATKPKGILLTCISPEPFVEPINNALAAGVPVVTFDTDSPNSKRLAFVSTDNSYLGEFLCKFFAENLLTNGKGTVGITGRPDQLNIRQRMDGFQKKAAADYPDMKIVGPVDNKGDVGKATAAVSAMLQANPDITTIFAADGIGAAGAAQAVSDLALTGIKIMTVDSTQDVLDLIKADQLYGTVAQNTYNMGYWGMMSMFAYTHNLVNPFSAWKTDKTSPLPPFINSGVDIVTKANADSFVVPTS